MKNNKTILFLDNLSQKDVNIAGGKGASLGEMRQANIPVPNGFVVLSSAFNLFIKNCGLDKKINRILKTVDIKNLETANKASVKIQKLILQQSISNQLSSSVKKNFLKLKSRYVAVRSSATAEDGSNQAWAGQLDTYLYTSPENLLENIKKCWASLFTLRAIIYRFKHSLDKQSISVAVVIQKMINSESAGVVFSVDPVSQEANHLIIESGLGLGEAIVAGSINPDRYKVSKYPLKIIEKNIFLQTRGLYQSKAGGTIWKPIPKNQGKKSVLNKEQILKLSKLVIKIEKYYDFPVDIEWAVEKGKIYITQARPITTLKLIDDSIKTEFGNWKLSITRNMSFWHQWLSGLGHFNSAQDFGDFLPNPQLAVTEKGVRSSLFISVPGINDEFKAVLKAIDTKRKVNELEKKYKLFANELLVSLQKCNQNLTIKNWQNFVSNYQRFCFGLFLTVAIGRAGSDKLSELLKAQRYNGKKIDEIISIITYPDTHTPLFLSQYDLLVIGSAVQKQKPTQSQIEKLLQKWLTKHSYIPVNFCENPWTMKNATEQLANILKNNCKKKLTELTKQHQNKIKEKNQILKHLNNREITTLAYALARGTYFNEFRKNIFSQVSLDYRNIFKQIAKLAGSKNWRDCFYLTADEMTSLLKNKKINIKKIKKGRQVIVYYTNSKGKNKIVTGDNAKKFINFIKSAYGETKNKNEKNSAKDITGFTANRGIVKGIARVILSSKDFNKLKPGEILVTTMTSVDFIPVMEKAGAFVTNEGGITCHAAIVAREMNKPCIIGTQIATKVIKSGDKIIVDADEGIVHIK